MTSVTNILGLFAYLFLFLIGIGVLWIILLYIIDVSQTKHAIRRNFPVIGRFRYVFERLGEFFRQYFFALDREEMPFNRAERSWVYRAAKGVDTTVAFGSTRDLRTAGTVIFANTAYPTLEEDGEGAAALHHRPLLPYALSVPIGCFISLAPVSVPFRNPPCSHCPRGRPRRVAG